ncbi:unnamed protein product [Coffea canephora]|uniref:Uncharacterized protein n=1 Tax=Coffea canephora TaxID=49390 RepID=A0A068URL1_COFCA|nr:unnamed protein product [Coffea canephora]
MKEKEGKWIGLIFYFEWANFGWVRIFFFWGFFIWSCVYFHEDGPRFFFWAGAKQIKINGPKPFFTKNQINKFSH